MRYCLMKRILCIFLAGSVTVYSSPVWAWDKATHKDATNRAIKILKQIDATDKLYQEIYDKNFKFYDKIVQGVKDEDVTKLYHFYKPGTWTGLKWEWYFGPGGSFLSQFGYGSQLKKKPASGYLDNALEWGQSLSDESWKKAVDEYDYSPTSKLNAYRMVGHEINLLQEMTQPDYPKLTFNPGSDESDTSLHKDAEWIAKALVGIYVESIDDDFKFLVKVIKEYGFEFVFDEIMASEPWYMKAIYWAMMKGFKGLGGKIAQVFVKVVGLIFAAAGAEQVYAAREARILQENLVSDAVGYERLIADNWSFKKIPMPSTIDPPYTGFQVYYDSMATRSIATMGKYTQTYGIKPPLGLKDFCMDLPTKDGYSCIPLIPTITKNDEGPYLKLATELLPKAADLSADFLRFYYKIANHPPYAWKVEVEQPEGTVIYRGTWLNNWDPTNKKYLLSRTLDIKKPELADLRCGVPAKITIYFTPLHKPDPDVPISNVPPIPKDMSQVKVTFDGITVEGKLKSSVPGTKAKDVWVGVFTYPCEKAQCKKKTATIEIWAQDGAPHYKTGKDGTRNHQGHILDSKPATPAKARSPKPYHWQGYEPGIDKSHKIDVLPAFEVEKVTPSSQYVKQGKSAKYQITIRSYAPDNPLKIAMGVSGLPLHSSHKFNPQIMDIPGFWLDNTSTLSIYTKLNTPKGIYLLKITGLSKKYNTSCSKPVELKIEITKEEIQGPDLNWLEPPYDVIRWPPFPLPDPPWLMNVDILLKNEGVMPIEEKYTISAYLDGELVYNEAGPLLAPGEEAEIAFSHDITEGDHVIKFIADTEDQINEIDEENNVFTFPFTAPPK